jgi:hypothetical protein
LDWRREEPKSSAEDRVIGAVDRLCARVREWHAAWVDVGEYPGVLWATQSVRQGWAGDSWQPFGHGRYMEALNDRIEFLRAARTLLRERLGESPGDA